MSFAVAGLKAPGIRIMDEVCVRKSFPGFWKRWKGFTDEMHRRTYRLRRFGMLTARYLASDFHVQVWDPAAAEQNVLSARACPSDLTTAAQSDVVIPAVRSPGSRRC